MHVKCGINMVSLAEVGATRLIEKGQTGPGWKRSSQKSPCGAVTGSQPRIGDGKQPGQ